MPKWTPAQFGRIERLFFEAEQVPPHELKAWLERVCADDPAVRAEVGQMLAAQPHKTIPPLMMAVQDAIVGGAGAGDVASRAAAADPRTLLGSKVGAYELTAILGHGGMGVVYKARDTRLGRAVAVKALPPALAGDPPRLSRFRREAKLLASLSHPNIATVFGLEERDASHFLVMELIEGQTLASRLQRGPLPIQDALQVCEEIAEGVEAAHDAGVIHRDLKPANVVCCPDGRVKVLDFGLAREVKTGGITAFAAAGASQPDPAQNVTQEGAVMGTPGYMSPEQVRGLPVDRRTDVFSIGCILFECLTGKLAFPGDTAADIVVQLIEREPKYDLLPPRTPESVRKLLRRCLTKDPTQRLKDVGDLRLDLFDALVAREWLNPPAGAAAPLTPGQRLARVVPWLLAAAAAVWVGVLLSRNGGGTNAGTPSVARAEPLRRFAIPLPGKPESLDPPRVRLSFTPDGSRMALTSFGDTDPHPYVYVRDRGDVGFRVVDDTPEAFSPALSPDGQWVAYYDDGAIRKKRLAGGNPVPLVYVTGFWAHPSWGTDGYITCCPVWARGIARVSESGGEPTYVTQIDAAKGEVSHYNPRVLPDNNGVLFETWDGGDTTNVWVVDLKTRQRHVVAERASSPRFARTPDGRSFVLYSREGTINALPFDPVTLKATGPEKAIVDGVLYVKALFHATFDVADDGTLAYVPGPLFDERCQLVWVSPAGVAGADGKPTWLDAAGKPAFTRKEFGDERQGFAEVVFDRTGTRFSCIFKSTQYRPYVYDPRRGFERVITEGDTTSAAISPDGQHLAYSAFVAADGYYRLFVRRLADGRSEKVFGGFSTYENQIEWSPDGKTLAFSMARHPQDARDVWTVDVTDLPHDAADKSADSAGREPRPLADGPGEQRTPRFSPNAKWLAFNGNDAGHREVYLRSLPDGQQRRQVTFGGGDWPDWSPDGRTLYYKQQGKIFAVGVDPDTGETTGRPYVVYDRRFGQIDWELHDFTVHPDGRLLVIEPAADGQRVSHVNVILNWHRLLER